MILVIYLQVLEQCSRGILPRGPELGFVEQMSHAEYLPSSKATVAVGPVPMAGTRSLGASTTLALLIFTVLGRERGHEATPRILLAARR